MEFEILNWVHATFHQTEWLNYLMKYISALAAHGEISIACCVVLLIFKKTRRCGFALAVALVLDFVVVNVVLKNVIGRERPWTHEELSWAPDFYNRYGIELATDYCFPSGHTAVTFCAAAVLLIYYRAKAIPAVFVALLIGLSRIYLCEHFVTDVAAGMVIGSLCGVLGWLLYRQAEKFALSWYKNNRYRIMSRMFITRVPKTYRKKSKFLSLFI